MTTGKSTAVLLCNLGTPDAPTAAALRRYLGQFLSDPRVVEIPRVLWLPLLHGVILRVRRRRSAAKYESVWTEAGSPLAVWTQRQVELLGDRLSEFHPPTPVLPAMRYGRPYVGTQLQALMDSGVQRVLVLPLYRRPRQAGRTSGCCVKAHVRFFLVKRLLGDSKSQIESELLRLNSATAEGM